MSVARPLALALTLLLAFPVAQAYSQPVFYFLKDPPGPADGVPASPVPVPVPIPVPVPSTNVADGLLDPYSRDAHNAPNGTTAKMRLVTPGTDVVVPVRFVTPGNASHPARIKGPLFVGLWTGESATYQANLTATMYEIPASGAAVAIANASISLDFNQSSAPDPTALLPQNQTDPTVIAFYELAQVLPVLLHPPAIFVLPVDITFGNDSSFAIAFSLTPGSSGAPVAEGAFASVEYDGLYAPSFVYVPWYAPDPARPTPTPRPTYSYDATGTNANSRPTTDEVLVGPDKKSPGPELAFGLAALALAAMVARRRHH
jgi:MYXO-CTERM domain-containing protein